MLLVTQKPARPPGPPLDLAEVVGQVRNRAAEAPRLAAFGCRSIARIHEGQALSADGAHPVLYFFTSKLLMPRGFAVYFPFTMGHTRHT